MDLKVIGSSSAGNCYLLDNGVEALLIECGMTWRKVQNAVDYDISRIKGAIISHEHGDHAKHAQKAAKACIPMYASKGTIGKIGLAGFNVHGMEAFTKYQMGNFEIMPFPVEHDAAEPFGFLIHHPETGLILFATDTCYLEYTFPGLSNILIECNYRQDILDANTISGVVGTAQRIRTMHSHMSLDTCLETLKANNLDEVSNIVLIHLSNNNADAAHFRTTISEATARQTHVARPGMVIPLNRHEF